ncbi:MAG: TlyA family RNA methyltransferase [bacterium]
MKDRLDSLLLKRGLAKSQQQAKALIMSGVILVDNLRIDKAGNTVDINAEIRVKGIKEGNTYVSRGGIKLAKALERFRVTVQDKIALDIGASTGGFTDCLLQHGAKKVYALDVGYGQLAWKLRIDPRVILLERKNIRCLGKEELPELADLITIDVSFISLTKVLPIAKNIVKESGYIIALIKPQFEVDKGEVERGGIIKDWRKHKKVIRKIGNCALELGLKVSKLIPSPIYGQGGNKEFFVLIKTTDN